jgi:hypothetical protein
LLFVPLLWLAVAAPARPAMAGPLSVKDVVKRMAAYVDSYGDKASIVVATERYRQEMQGTLAPPHDARETVADFAIVHVAAEHTWLGFRDVIEVDGRRVSDREDRLAAVLMRSAGRFDEAQRLSDESARFNIGGVERNFNVPTTVLFYFAPENLDRFKFAARTVAVDGTWEIAFRETHRPTLIRTPEGRSVASEGTVWVHPEDGTIVRTLLKVGGSGLGGPPGLFCTGTYDVTYRLVEDIGMWLPETMIERFDSHAPRGAWERDEGRASYSNYRTFQTDVRIK